MDVICVLSLGLIQNELKIISVLMLKAIIGFLSIVKILSITASISYLFQTYSSCKIYPIAKLYMVI